MDKVLDNLKELAKKAVSKEQLLNALEEALTTLVKDNPGIPDVLEGLLLEQIDKIDGEKDL